MFRLTQPFPHDESQHVASTEAPGPNGGAGVSGGRHRTGLKPRLDAPDLLPLRTQDRNDCERASLVQRFVVATVGVSTRQLQAETGISQPTMFA